MMTRFLTICLVLLLSAVALSTAGWAQSYRIRAGDVLAIEVLEDPSLNRETLVLPGGTITFPLAGTLGAAGKSVDALQSDLASALAPNFAAPPSVFVSVRSLTSGETGGSATLDVFVMGEVAKPGKIEVDRGTTLLQVLAMTGGFTKFAATKRIQLRRANPSTGAYATYKFNYRALEDGAAISGQTLISDGDVVVVPQRRLFE